MALSDPKNMDMDGNMEIKIDCWWFSIWGLFVHDAHVIGPFSIDKIEEWINEELCGSGYVVMCPDSCGRRAWHLYCDGHCVIGERLLHTSTEAEAEIKRLAPAAHEALAEIDQTTFSM